MRFFIGIIIVLVCVFGGYFLSGGKMYVIMKALPFEMMIIGGAAVGAFIIANSGTVIKQSMAGIKKVIAGPKWTKDDYKNLLLLLFTLVKLMKTKGMVAVEQHIENPDESDIFTKYPRIANDHHIRDFIRDSIRLMTMDYNNPYEFDDAMTSLLEKHHAEEHEAVHSLQTMADGLPALGIVAAVLGVIKTMSSVDQPPEVLGKMIAAALVGTFLGVFLSYGIVGPISARLDQIVTEEGQMHEVIREVLISYLQGNAVQVTVEIGRNSIPTKLQPDFYEIEEAIGELPPIGAD